MDDKPLAVFVQVDRDDIVAWCADDRERVIGEGKCEQAAGFNRLVVDGRIDPCLSQTFGFDEIGTAHQLMSENQHPEGNMAALVGAFREGLTDLPD